MSEQQPSPGAQQWPEGVIARYLTVAGATVDLARKQIRHTFPDGILGTRGLTSATCTGCPASGEFPHWRTRTGTWSGSWDEDIPAEKADADARDWAQAHAEKCRALPRPAVTA
jgi:hypothetical protein